MSILWPEILTATGLPAPRFTGISRAGWKKFHNHLGDSYVDYIKGYLMKTICGYSIETYMSMVEKFHGSMAPGIIIGGFMVHTLWQHRNPEKLYDFLCETSVCLPDAIQLLTPCTYGNGWLKVVHTGRFAMAMFDKLTGAGRRACLDAQKLEPYQEIKNWFFKLKPKKMQDKDLLINQIIAAGETILSVQDVQIGHTYLGKERLGPVGICPDCGEAYPQKDGKRCIVCQGLTLYEK
ncbi:MAG TPA: formylmethanofuran dehydrogenase subunit E family protein [Spirochaetota bacterium]|nr:formylmethanofuran dehydrogenase subunit E family protein [Spirochaetota bacterium]